MAADPKARATVSLILFLKKDHYTKPILTIFFIIHSSSLRDVQKSLAHIILMVLTSTGDFLIRRQIWRTIVFSYLKFEMSWTVLEVTA